MLRLIRTEKKSDWDLFHEVPRSSRGARSSFLNRGASSKEEAPLFQFLEHSFYRHALVQGFVAVLEDRPVARLAAFVDFEFVRERKEKVGFLGFFSHAPDAPPEAAGLIFEGAREWLSSEGMTAFLAPVEQSFWSGWGWTVEEERFWESALQGLGAREVLSVADYPVQLDEFMWPIEIESRAEIVAQATRAKLLESNGSSRLAGFFSPAERILAPSAREKLVRKDLGTYELIRESFVTCQDGVRTLPWEGIPNPSDWLAWREHTRSTHLDLDIEVAGVRAGWVGLWKSENRGGKLARVEHLELMDSYRDFDLLPWILVSVSKWASENGIHSLLWRGADEKSPVGRLFNTAFPRIAPAKRSLVGGVLNRQPVRRG